MLFNEGKRREQKSRQTCESRWVVSSETETEQARGGRARGEEREEEIGIGIGIGRGSEARSASMTTHRFWLTSF